MRWRRGVQLVRTSGFVLLWLLAAAEFSIASPMQLKTVAADVRPVFLSVAKAGGFNLILDDGVTGSVTLNLSGEPERLLELIAASQGLCAVKDGNVYVVTTAKKAAAMRRVHAYTVRYADPHELACAVNMSLQSEGKSDSAANNIIGDKKKSKMKEWNEREENRAGRVLVDESAGALLFYGTESEAQSAEAVLRKLDIPAPQVSLEARVVALSREASKHLGIEWQWSDLPQYPEHRRTYRHEGKSNERREDEVYRHWNGGDQIPGVIQFGHGPDGVPFEAYFSARINALISQGKARILARPNITTVQGHEAVINIGGDIPVPVQSVTNATTTTSITYRQAGIILRCLPRVNADGQITAVVHTEVSSPLYVNDIKAYRFQKRSADTMVRLCDGGTMVIGGLIGSEESRSLSKVPFLGDLPVLGGFFRNLKRNHTESEVMIFLTAHQLSDSGGPKDTSP